MSNAMRFDVFANDKASATFRKIAAEAEALERKLKELDKKITPSVRLDGAPGVKRDVQSIRRDMDRIRDIRAKVRVSVAGNAPLTNLAQQLDRLSDARISVHVSIEPPGIEARIRSLGALLRSLDGRTTHTVDVNTGGATRRIGMLRRLLSGLTGKQGLAPFVTSLMAVGAAATAATASLGAMTAAAATLGGSLVATGPILVASLGMIGGVLATLKVGTQGLGMAFEAIAEGNMKDFGKALANLSPEAGKFATAIKGVWGELRQAQGAIQDKLFEGMDVAVTKLASTALPMLQKGMGGVATELNLAAKSVMDYIGSSEGIARQEVMWANTATVVKNLRPWLTNVTAAMFDIGEVGSTVLADITGGAGEAGLGFRNMIAEARRSGELEASMRRGVEVLRQLGSVAGNVGNILGSIFIAARTAGSDFLATLDRGTEALATFMRSGQGQTALVDFFRESSATLAALREGLGAAASAVAGFVSAFSNTGGLAAAGAALSDIMTALAPLGETLGRLAGETLGVLASAASTAASALAPLVGLFSGILDGLGPIVPAVLAMVVAFKGLGLAGAGIIALGTAAQAAALKIGVYTAAIVGSQAAGIGAATAASRFGMALSAVGRALPYIGVAIVGLGAIYNEFAADIEGAAERVTQGSLSMSAAIAEQATVIDRNGIDMLGGADAAEAYAVAQREVTAEVEKQIAAMSPFEQLQARAAMAQATLNDVVAQFGASSPQAAAAAAALATATGALEAAEQGAEAAISATNRSLEDRISAVQTALGGMLQMEEALSRVADAEKAANEAAAQYGAGSKEAADANREFAGAADQAAQAAQQQAIELAKTQGASNSAEVGARAYASTLAQVAATASGPAKAGMLSYLASLSDADLAAVNAAAAASGFKVEMLALPDGRNIAIAVDPETGEIISTQVLLDSIQDKTITINGEAMPAQQALTSVLSQIAAGEESVSINGEAMPAQQALAAVLGMITGSSGSVTIRGEAHEAQAVLDSVIAAIAAGSETVDIGGNPVPVNEVLAAVIGAINSGRGEVTLDANGQPVETAKTSAEAPTSSEHTLGAPVTDNTTAPKAGAEAATGNPHTVGDPVTDNTGAAKGTAREPSGNPHTVGETVNDFTTGPKTTAREPTGNPHKIGDPITDNTVGPKATAGAATGNPHTVGSPVTDNTTGPKATAGAATGNPHTVGAPVTDNVGPAKSTAEQPSRSLHTLDVDEQPVLDAKGRAEQATTSLHTITCNDDQVTTAKANARNPTSSTHTINVVVTGAAPPRAAGAYTTPRAEGAYAAPMAAGGMRKMSAARAEIVPPRQPRIIGDRMEGDEAFIPINQSTRSQSILNTAAQRMGYDLVPRATDLATNPAAPEGLLSSMRAAVSQRPAARAGGGDARVVAAIEALRRDLSAAPRQIHNEINVKGAGADATADAIAQRQRRTAALGLFG
jgi:DNA-binding protein